MSLLIPLGTSSKAIYSALVIANVLNAALTVASVCLFVTMHDFYDNFDF